MSLKKLTTSMDASLSMRRNINKPDCSDDNHIIDFQMELLHKLHPNIELDHGPKQHLFSYDNNDLQAIKNDISYIWRKYDTLIKKIRFWRYMKLISLCFILTLIIPNIIAYSLFIKNDIDTQNNNSCSSFVFIYELCLLVIIGWPLMYLQMRRYHNSLTKKWRSNFINNMVILINNKLSKTYASKQWIFQVIYPIKVQRPQQRPTNWCYLRIISNIDEHTQNSNDHKQPIYATSKIYDGETHLVKDFDIYLKDDILGINIINGKKKHEFNHENVDQEIGEFIMDLRIKYENCLCRILWVLLIGVCLGMLSIPWLVCSGYITGKATVDNKGFNIEIYIIVGGSIAAVIAFVIVVFCSRIWLFKLRKHNFMKKLQRFMNDVLSVKYPNYAYSIIYPKKEENLWCQLRISDHVLKCRNDDSILHTTYNDKTSISIRNQSFNATSPDIKSPLLS